MNKYLVLEWKLAKLGEYISLLMFSLNLGLLFRVSSAKLDLFSGSQ